MKKGYFISIMVGVLAIVLTLGVTTPVSANDELRGKPFSDPAKKTDMPDEWVQKPIRYKPEVESADITIDINQQLYTVLLPLVKQFGKQNKLKIAFSRGTCGKSFGMLNRKEIDVGGMCCPPGVLDRLPGLRFHTLGILPLAILVHADNPVENVSLKQARDIFQGDITNWSQVGGPDQAISPVSSFHCRIRPGHWRLLLDNEELFGPEVREVGEMSDMIYHLAVNPWTVGYEVMLVANLFKEHGEVKPLEIDGYSPKDPGALLSGRYPIYRTFAVTTWEAAGNVNPKARELVDYLLTRIEEIGIEKYGFVTSRRLRQAGWKFNQNELVGEPDSSD